MMKYNDLFETIRELSKDSFGTLQGVEAFEITITDKGRYQYVDRFFSSMSKEMIEEILEEVIGNNVAWQLFQLSDESDPVMLGFFNRNEVIEYYSDDGELLILTDDEVFCWDPAGKLQPVVISDYNTVVIGVDEEGTNDLWDSLNLSEIEGCVADVLVHRYWDGHNWKTMTANYSGG
jgi:hypothetical protein